ncbi:hypothetical protein [Synechococcus sp. UW140]|uniref:hypothetical protein n=1 Tax=Synechococcus sp. UW140 TaxID=368503 RepID=UPI0031383863
MDLDQTLRHNHDWAVVRIDRLLTNNPTAATAIRSEFSEWLDPSIPEHDVFSINAH